MCHWHSQQGMHGYLFGKRFVRHQLDKEDNDYLEEYCTSPALFNSSTSGGVCSVLVLMPIQFQEQEARYENIWKWWKCIGDRKARPHWLEFNHTVPHVFPHQSLFQNSNKFTISKHVFPRITIWENQKHRIPDYLRSLFVKLHYFLTDVLTKKSL